jgi:hypothetical protein
MDLNMQTLSTDKKHFLVLYLKASQKLCRPCYLGNFRYLNQMLEDKNYLYNQDTNVWSVKVFYGLKFYELFSSYIPIADDQRC